MNKLNIKLLIIPAKNYPCMVKQIKLVINKHDINNKKASSLNHTQMIDNDYKLYDICNGI